MTREEFIQALEERGFKEGPNTGLHLSFTLEFKQATVSVLSNRHHVWVKAVKGGSILFKLDNIPYARPMMLLLDGLIWALSVDEAKGAAE